MITRLIKDKIFIGFFFIGFFGFLGPLINSSHKESAIPPSLHTLFLLIIFFPVLEECLFRGILQGLLLKIPFMQKHYISITLSNLLTSILFVVMHFFYHTPWWATLVFFPSIILGYLRERFHNLLPPIILHIWYNFIYFIFINNDYI